MRDGLRHRLVLKGFDAEFFLPRDLSMAEAARIASWLWAIQADAPEAPLWKMKCEHGVDTEVTCPACIARMVAQVATTSGSERPRCRVCGSVWGCGEPPPGVTT